MQTVFEMPELPKIVLDEFLNLPLGGKNIITPYYINKRKERAGLRVLVGKGDPGEIAREVRVWAQLKGFDLMKANTEQIRKFMLDYNIGIDCSGFVTHVLNGWLRGQGDRPLINYLNFPSNNFIARLRRKLRPVENIGAELLTNEINCDKIFNLNEIRPGDLIRSKGLRKNSHHILIVSQVVMEKDVIKEFTYINSTEYYDDQNGIRIGKVLIINPQAQLKDQTWTDVKDGRNWTYEGLMQDYEDNGVRRLKNINLKFTTRH